MRMNRTILGSLLALWVVRGVSIASAAAAVTAGTQHAVVLTDTGVLWAWGANGSGQLGDGTYADKAVPTFVAGGSAERRYGR